MTRTIQHTLALTVLMTVALGCQTPGQLFGKRDLPKASDFDVAETESEDPSTATRDLIDRADREFAAQRYQAAAPLYQTVLRQAPASAHAHHRLAVIADLESRYADAEEHYQAALIRDSRNSQILSDLGYSYIMQARFDEAETRLNQARANDPSNLNAAANLALLYAHLGEKEKCLAVAKLLGSPEGPEKTVEALFAQAGRDINEPTDSNIQLAGAFDFLRRKDKNADAGEPDVNRETLDLAERLRAARDESIRERRARDAADPRRQIPSTRDALNPFAVPPERMNEALSNIDREGITQPQHVAPTTQWPPQAPQAMQPARPQQPQNPFANQAAPMSPQRPYDSHMSHQPAPSPSGVVNANLTGQTQWPPATPAAGEAFYPEVNAAPRQQPTPGTAANWADNVPGTAQMQSGQPQYPSANANDMEAARRAAVSMGMGTGLGGMFDRYAYKQPGGQPQMQSPSPATPSPQASGFGQPQPYGQPPQPQYGAQPQYGPQAQYGPGTAVPFGSADTTNSSRAIDPQVQPQLSPAQPQPGVRQSPNGPSPADAFANQATTPREWAGTNSRFGSQYPAVERQLPTARSATPPAISPGMPVPRNWQGQSMPTSTPQLSGPGNYGTIAPTGALAPTPPASSFGPPVMNTQPLPRPQSPQAALNDEFNQLQRSMLGTPNLVPANGPTAFDANPNTSWGQQPTATGPNNPNVPYYTRSTGPTAGGFPTQAPANANQPPTSQSLPPGFVQPPPYNGGANIQPRTSTGQQPPSGSVSPNAGGQMPQISPRN